MKKLVTVVWSVTVAVDVPEEFNAEAQAACLNEAWSQVQKGDGEITDVQEAD